MVNAYSALVNHGPAVSADPDRLRAGPSRQGDLARGQARVHRLQHGQVGRQGDAALQADRASRCSMPRTAFQVVHMLDGVVQRGTAVVLRDLNLPLFGKTGTTSGPTNVWFVGGSPDIVAGVYMGYRPAAQPRRLCPGRHHCRADLQAVRQGKPRPLERPAVRRARRASAWSGSTALRARACSVAGRATIRKCGVIWEAFKPDTEPRRGALQDEIDATARHGHRAAPAPRAEDAARAVLLARPRRGRRRTSPKNRAGSIDLTAEPRAATGDNTMIVHRTCLLPPLPRCSLALPRCRPRAELPDRRDSAEFRHARARWRARISPSISRRR